MTQSSDSDFTEPADEAPIIDAQVVETPRGFFGLIFLDSTPRLRTFWRFLIFFLGLAAIVLVFSIVLVVGLLINLVISDSMPNDISTSQEIETGLKNWIDQHPALLFVIQAPFLPLMAFGLVLICRKFLDRRSIWSMGLGRPERRLRCSATVGFVLGVLPIAIGVALVWMLGGYQRTDSTLSWFTLPIIPAMVMMAFFEEIVVRGYLLQNLIDIRQTVFGVIFTSLLFCFAHALNPGATESVWPTINLFGAGIVLSLAYIASGNIWFPTAMHFSWNLTQGVVFGLPVSGIAIQGIVPLEPVPAAPTWLTGGSFGLEASVVCTAVEVVLIVLFLVVIFGSKNQQQ